jgi:flagella synthesis protein FlgN
VSDSVSIVQTLNHQLQQLTDLEALLNAELQVLQQHDPQKLIDINTNKNALLVNIDTTDKELATNQEFLKNKAEGMYAEQMQAIEAILNQCKDLNKVNGEIIHKSQLSVERMRATLLESNTKSSMTYDSKGKKSGGYSRMDIKA